LFCVPQIFAVAASSPGRATPTEFPWDADGALGNQCPARPCAAATKHKKKKISKPAFALDWRRALRTPCPVRPCRTHVSELGAARAPDRISSSSLPSAEGGNPGPEGSAIPLSPAKKENTRNGSDPLMPCWETVDPAFLGRRARRGSRFQDPLIRSVDIMLKTRWPAFKPDNYSPVVSGARSAFLSQA